LADIDQARSGGDRTGGRLRRSSSSRSRTHHHTQSHSHSHSHSQKKLLRLQLLALGLGAALLLVIGGWSLTGVKLALLSSQLADLETAHQKQQVEARDLSNEIDRLEDALAAMKKENAALVRGRIPDLVPLEFDVTLPVEHDHVRNVSFTVVGNSAEKQYEYRAVLQNQSDSLVQASVEIHVFDELGIEIGAANVSVNQVREGPKRVVLEAGETQTFHGFISLIQNTEPKYFLVTVK